MVWPEWWEWDIELTPHLLNRMEDRNFTETDLRVMLDEATALRRAGQEGRFIVSARHESRQWEIVIEPDETEQVLVIITAYPFAPS